MWHVAKEVLGGQFIAIRPTSRNKKKYKQSNLPSKGIRNTKTKPKVNRRKEITKIREEINKIETKRKEKENTNETKIWLF